MADIADVKALLGQMAAAACYPNGTGSASVTGASGDIKVEMDWPIPAQLDADIAAGKTTISIVQLGGASANVFQVLDEVYPIIPAVHGLTAAISGGTVTVSGTPSATEYLSVIADGRHAYSRVGATVAAILAAIAADAVGDYPSVSVSGNAITFPTTRLTAKSGAAATVGKVTHRQKDQVSLAVWAPTQLNRDIVAAAVDVAMKAVNRLTFPDTSQGVLAFSHGIQRDEGAAKSIHRRDLVYTVEYATLAQFTAYEVTVFNPSVTVEPPTSDMTGVGAQSFTIGV